MLGKLTHLKSFELEDCVLMYEPDFLINIHEIIPSLETLIMTHSYSTVDPLAEIAINYLIEALDSIGNVKNLTIKGYGFQYLLNHKALREPLQNNLSEDQTKNVFERAMEVINKKFQINSTRFEIVDNEYGWRIKKEEGKIPSMTRLPYKCNVKTHWIGEVCPKFFATEAKLWMHYFDRY